MKKIKESVVVKCNGRKELIECRNRLIQFGFNDDTDWNERQVNDDLYSEYPDCCYILISEPSKNIQIHNHTCCEVAEKMIQYSKLDKYIEDVYGFKACYSIKELGEVQCIEDMETFRPKKCPSINIDLGLKKDNFVIEVLDLEHGQKVKKYFESLGIDTKGYQFGYTKEHGYNHRYYGLVDGVFGAFNFYKLKNVELITLPAEEAETLEQKIKQLALEHNKVIKKIELEDVPKTEWCLVWHKGSLKPNIVHKDCVDGFDSIISLPVEFSEFINRNFMQIK